MSESSNQNEDHTIYGMCDKNLLVLEDPYLLDVLKYEKIYGEDFTHELPSSEHTAYIASFLNNEDPYANKDKAWEDFDPMYPWVLSPFGESIYNKAFSIVCFLSGWDIEYDTKAKNILYSDDSPVDVGEDCCDNLKVRIIPLPSENVLLVYYKNEVDDSENFGKEGFFFYTNQKLWNILKNELKIW